MDEWFPNFKLATRPFRRFDYHEKRRFPRSIESPICKADSFPPLYFSPLRFFFNNALGGGASSSQSLSPGNARSPLTHNTRDTLRRLCWRCGRFPPSIVSSRSPSTHRHRPCHAPPLSPPPVFSPLFISFSCTHPSPNPPSLPSGSLFSLAARFHSFVSP